MVYFYLAGGKRPKPPPPTTSIYASGSVVMSQKIEGGTIFERERSDRAGGGCGRGVSHARELFHFST